MNTIFVDDLVHGCLGEQALVARLRISFSEGAEEEQMVSRPALGNTVYLQQAEATRSMTQNPRLTQLSPASNAWHTG